MGPPRAGAPGVGMGMAQAKGTGHTRSQQAAPRGNAEGKGQATAPSGHQGTSLHHSLHVPRVWEEGRDRAEV